MVVQSPGPTVNGDTSDTNGHMSVAFSNIDVKELKAEKSRPAHYLGNLINEKKVNSFNGINSR